MSSDTHAPVRNVRRLPGAIDDGRPTKTVPCPGCGQSVTVWISIGFPICSHCESRGPFSHDERVLILNRKSLIDDIVAKRGVKFHDVTKERMRVPEMFADAKPTPDIAEWSRSPRRTLVLFGPVGTGKSHLSVGAIRAILHRVPGDGYLVNCTTIARMSRTEFDIWSRCAVLSLDDFGSKLTPAAIASAYEVIDYRISHLMPLIITTNLTPDTIGAVDERIDSRLSMALWLEMRGADRRLG